MTEEKTFPLEKILTVSARDYIDSHPENSFDCYEMRGVHVETDESIFIHEFFSRQVPEDAEVVVGYRVLVSYDGAHDSIRIASGTALIRKK